MNCKEYENNAIVYMLNVLPYLILAPDANNKAKIEYRLTIYKCVNFWKVFYGGNDYALVECEKRSLLEALQFIFNYLMSNNFIDEQ